MIKSVMIADDEYYSRESLKSLLGKYCTGVDVVMQADSVATACELLSTQTPDLLFLDIMMPDGNGFDVLEAFPERSFKVIFVTAHDSFAVKAFRFAALDYLLKPISIGMLRESVQRFQLEESSVIAKTSMEAASYYFNTHQFDRLIIPSQEGYLFIKAAEIIALEANSNYSIIHRVNEKPLLASKTLLEFEMMLQHQGFYRIHHSHMINLMHVTCYHHKDNCVEMNNGKFYAVSSRKKASFNDFCRLLAESRMHFQ